MKILIVEDEANTRVGISRLIQKYSSHQIVGEAKNGTEGLELAKKMSPDLIITDIRMPEMSGLDMLEKLYSEEEGIYENIYVVILSGYADFDYARKAISMNGKVLEYLLKPIDVEKIINGMEEWETAIRNKRINQNRPEQIIRNVIFENVHMDDEILEKMIYICKCSEKGSYLLFWGYIGAAEENYEKEVKRRFLKCKEKNHCSHVYFITAEKEKSIICLMTDVRDRKNILEEFRKKEVERYGTRKQYPVWAAEEFEDLREIQSRAGKLQKFITYGLVFEGRVLLTEDEVKNFREEKYSYPYEIEKEIKVAICAENTNDIEKGLRNFGEYMRNHLYSPEQIRQGYTKLISYIQNLTNEMNMGAGKKLQQFQILYQFQKVIVWKEIENLCEQLLKYFEENGKEKNNISNYIILKAIAYIREHYAEGITLEEVARKLEITPEYLSALFNREMNIKFSIFVKEFRISHAKRLLKGTNLKIYEIAQMVGYQDPKYFNRVFKEVQGISPGEFREG